jgi:hypothetical protein
VVQGGPTRPVSSSRGLRCSAPRVCDRTLVWPDQRVRSVHLAQRKGARKARDQGVRGSPGPERPVSITCAAWWRDAKRTRWRVRSRATGRVRSREELSGLRSDAGCSASGQTAKHVRSRQRLSLTRTAGICPVVTGRVRSP